MKKGKKHTSKLSSILVAPIFIVIAFIVSLIADRAGLNMLSVFLFSLFAVGLTARIWGFNALRRVNISISGETVTMSVGDTTELTYTIENNKLLPLTWLELCFKAPENGCVAPDSGFSLHRFQEPEANAEGSAAIFRRRIMFVMGYQSISWKTVWSARRRGVYEASKVSLRSGDGFGLSRSIQDIDTDCRIFVVWPKIIPVDTAPFFRNVWLGGAGRRGYVEDQTVLRGLRDYLPGDPWKRIDWRTAARSDELMVRNFETILPATVHFALDSASFSGISEDERELEDCISVLASLILELSAIGISCGLSLPRGDGYPSVNISSEDPAMDARDLLNSLAVFQADKATGGFDEEFINSLSLTVGQLWIVTYSGARLSCRSLVERTETSGFFALCSDTNDPGYLSGRPMLSIDRVKRGES